MTHDQQEGRQKETEGDKSGTMTKGDKKGDKRKQKGDQTDTMINKKGGKKTKGNRRVTRRTH